MQKLGYNKQQADKFEQSNFYYPSPSDLVSWQAREVFEPDMVEKYGLDNELEGVEREAFYRAGMTDEQIRNYWRAHWEHPSYRRMAEMLHRGEVTEQDMWEWFRVVEVPPFWREKLINIAYRPYTRVDVRRMFDTGTLDWTSMVQAYLDYGYNQERAQNMAEFTSVFYIDDDFMRGDLSEEGVKKYLAERKVPTNTINKVMTTLQKKKELVTRPEERNLTRSQIEKLYKRQLATKEEIKKKLGEIGYDKREVEMIISIWDMELNETE